MPESAAKRQARLLEEQRQERFDEGRAQGHQDVLDWLQRKYIGDKARPDRGTPKAEAILELAKEAHQYFQQ